MFPSIQTAVIGDPCRKPKSLDRFVNCRGSRPMNLDRVEKYAPEMLSIVRIVVALLFLVHGSAKLFGFSTSPHGEPAFLTLMWIQRLFESAVRYWRWVF